MCTQSIIRPVPCEQVLIKLYSHYVNNIYMRTHVHQHTYMLVHNWNTSK